MVAFTGSTAVGRGIASKASVLFKKYSLEMGGKNPLILLKDFDVEQAVRIAGFGSGDPGEGLEGARSYGPDRTGTGAGL